MLVIALFDTGDGMGLDEEPSDYMGQDDGPSDGMFA